MSLACPHRCYSPGLDPCSLSALAEFCPMATPEDQTVSRFQSREQRLSPAAFGETAQSETRTAILTELWDAVQSSNPEMEPASGTEQDSIRIRGRTLRPP